MKSYVLLLLCSTVICFTCCVKEAVQNPDKSVSLTYDTLRMVKGTTQLLASKNFTSAELKWSSADTTVVTVDATGLVKAKKAGKTVINAQSLAVSTAISANCTVIVTESTAPGNTAGTGTVNSAISALGIKATDIGIGAEGSVYIVGADALTGGGHSISKFENGKLTKLPDCGAMRVAVSPAGVPWVIDNAAHIRRYNGASWDLVPGSANDIGIGAEGSVFIIGTQEVSYTGGYNILKWNGSTWDTMPDCAGMRISVGPKGTPWVVNKLNIVYQYTGNYLWSPVYGISGTDLAVGADGSVYVAGQSLIAGSSIYTAALYKYAATDNSWTVVPDASGTAVAVSPQGLPWWTDSANNVYKLTK